MYELLEAEFRTKPVKSIRKDGYIPGVIFGKGMESLSFQVPWTKFKSFYKHSGKVFQIEVSGKGKYLVNVDDVQWDHMHDKMMHLSFHKLEENQKTVVKVPIHLVGTPVGTKEGGVVNQVLDEVELRGLPKDFPEFVEWDITDLEFDGHWTLSHFSLPKGLEFAHEGEGEMNVVSCHPAKVYKEPEVETPEVEAAAEGEEAPVAEAPVEEAKEDKAA